MGLGAAGSGAGASPPASWGQRLAAEGCTSTGATMSVAASVPAGCCSCGGEHHRHYCVNIYVNSNVQGVANSVLVGSKVVMRDPGPRVSSRHRQPPRRDGGGRRREGKPSSRQQQEKPKTTKVGIVVVAVVWLLFVAAAAATGHYLYLFVRVRQ